MSTLQTFPVQTPAQLSVHLKSLRKAQGLTQTALGQRIGVKQACIADGEKNPGAVSPNQLMQVLHAVGPVGNFQPVLGRWSGRTVFAIDTATKQQQRH